jgi:hypothetical protein|nr:MAG TPA: hypothetical protein [Caudoviricetes sp.]
MAVNKVIYGGNTLVDLTGDTVTANDLAEGITATGANGSKVVGVMTKGEIATNSEIDNALNLAGTGTIPSGDSITVKTLTVTDTLNIPGGKIWIG